LLLFTFLLFVVGLLLTDGTKGRQPTSLHAALLRAVTWPYAGNDKVNASGFGNPQKVDVTGIAIVLLQPHLRVDRAAKVVLGVLVWAAEVKQVNLVCLHAGCGLKASQLPSQKDILQRQH